MSQTVGNLLVDEVDILAIILPVVIVLVLAVILAVVLITLRRKRRRQREKNLQKMAYKPGNVRYVKQNGEYSTPHLLSAIMVSVARRQNVIGFDIRRIAYILPRDWCQSQFSTWSRHLENAVSNLPDYQLRSLTIF